MINPNCRFMMVPSTKAETGENMHGRAYGGGARAGHIEQARLGYYRMLVNRGHPLSGWIRRFENQEKRRADIETGWTVLESSVEERSCFEASIGRTHVGLEHFGHQSGPMSRPTFQERFQRLFTLVFHSERGAHCRYVDRIAGKSATHLAYPPRASLAQSRYTPKQMLGRLISFWSRTSRAPSWAL